LPSENVCQEKRNQGDPKQREVAKNLVWGEGKYLRRGNSDKVYFAKNREEGEAGLGRG